MAELRLIANRLFAYLEETRSDEFEVPEDFCRSIERDEVCDPLKDPKNLTMGQLSDDWKELSAILEGDNPHIGYSLVWLSAILRTIGEKAVY